MENSEFYCEKVQRYVDILTDAGFKAVFGDERNKDVLVDLINVVLPEDRHVKDIAYSTTEIPGLTLANKSIRLDLRCTGDDGSVFIVELQCYHQHNFFKRCVEYAAKVYDSGSARGDAGNYGLPPVYFIGLMAKDAPVFDRSDEVVWKDRFVSEYTFREKVSHDVVDDTIFLIFVELNRFDKRDKECVSMMIKAFERLFEACEIAKFDPDTKLKYEHDMMTEKDYYSILNTYRDEGIQEGIAKGKEEGVKEGFEKGIEKGIEKGRNEGQEKEKIKIATAMLKMELSAETIMQATGLSAEEVARLKDL